MAIAYPISILILPFFLFLTLLIKSCSVSLFSFFFFFFPDCIAHGENISQLPLQLGVVMSILDKLKSLDGTLGENSIDGAGSVGYRFPVFPFTASPDTGLKDAYTRTKL